MAANIDYPYTRASTRYFELMEKMSYAEIKIVGAVIRMSVGWDKEYAAISYSNFMAFTGIKSRTTVSSAIKSSIKKRYISRSEKTGKLGKKLYSLGHALRNSPKPNIEDKTTKSDTTILPEIVSLTETIDNKSNGNSSTMSVPIDDKAEQPLSTNERTSTSTMSIPIEGSTSTVIVPHIKKEVPKEKEIKEKVLSATSTDTSNSSASKPSTEPDDILSDELEEKPQPTDNSNTEITSNTNDEPAYDFMDDLDLSPTYYDLELYPEEDVDWVWTDERITDFSDKPYTSKEYEYYVVGRAVGTMSPNILASHVFDPIHECQYPRNSYPKPKKLSDWNKLIAVVMKFFPDQKTEQMAGKIANQLRGKAKKGTRKEFNIEPAMDAVEAYAYSRWLVEIKELTGKFFPTSAEKINEKVELFRSVHDHFAHVNFARYLLNELLPEPPGEIMTDNEPHEKSMSPEDWDQFLVDFKDDMGFDLIGDC